jgi:hypothetical protein
MIIEPIIFFDLVVAILVLAATLIAIIFYQSRTTKTPYTNFTLKDEPVEENTSSLEEAGMKAIKIIDEANNHALDIVNKVTLSANETSENFKQNLLRVSSAQIKEFEKITSDFTAIYSQILQDLKTKNIEAFQSVSKDIEVNTLEEIKDFRESMKKLTTSSQKEVKKKIDTEYEATRLELENYKKEELQKIESGIYNFLEKMSKLVLGKAINLSDHQDLIEKSLEKAIKEKAFE